MRKNQKQWWTSKTMWIAIIQGVSGVITVIVSENAIPEAVGALMVIKALLDVSLRLITNKEIA